MMMIIMMRDHNCTSHHLFNMFNADFPITHVTALPAIQMHPNCSGIDMAPQSVAVIIWYSSHLKKNII